MCGITGIYSFNEKGNAFINSINNSVKTLRQRGPDGDGVYRHNQVALGHTRLAVIDTTDAAAQPFTDISGRYTIIFNGEFYNYKEHRALLEQKGVVFRSSGDTEVLLYMYIHYGPDFIKEVNGCFSIAIYDKIEESLFLTRDRFGINPMVVYQDEDKLIFASEIKAILAFGITKKMDYSSLLMYLQLNYIPTPYSVFENVKKMTPGWYCFVKNRKVDYTCYYSIPKGQINSDLSYDSAQKQLIDLLDAAVQRRLIADVPLGGFLSGGIDSSIIAALASRHTKHFNTFSIGYKDEPFFDETKYANLVAKKFNTNHTVFSLTNNDLYNHLFDVLDYLDEPFADSSAIAVYILSKETRKHVTVALSGDGADELFAGYNKHRAHYNALKNNMFNSVIKHTSTIWNNIPTSRNNQIGNIFRQLSKYSEGLKLSSAERYWSWCSIMSEKQAVNTILLNSNLEEYFYRKEKILNNITNKSGMADLLYSDMCLVLQGDMLTKVDMMSMASSLEVRTPFLDHNVVNFTVTLSDNYKIDNNMKKKILQDAFREILPSELYNRPKHGFEVPLLKWLRTDLKSMIENEWLNDEFISDQKIFNPEAISKLKKKLFSTNPNDVHAQIWALIVFQNWWKKYFA